MTFLTIALGYVVGKILWGALMVTLVFTVFGLFKLGEMFTKRF